VLIFCYLIKEKPQFAGEYGFKAFLTYFFKFGYLKTVLNAVADRNRRKKDKNASEVAEPKESKPGFVKDCVVLILGGGAVIVGAHYLIAEAVFFAELFAISAQSTFLVIEVRIQRSQKLFNLQKSRYPWY
jgi:Ca2+/Na+ antiporter